MPVNYAQLKKFAKQWEIPKVEIEDFLDKFLIDMAEEIITKTKDRQTAKGAIDTDTMRRAWRSGVDIVQSSSKQKVDPVYVVTGVTREGVKLKINLVNGMEYSSFLEYGTPNRKWKWQEGIFMLTLSIDEVEKKMNSKFQPAFKSFFAKKGLV